MLVTFYIECSYIKQFCAKITFGWLQHVYRLFSENVKKMEMSKLVVKSNETTALFRTAKYREFWGFAFYANSNEIPINDNWPSWNLI